jgi:putative MATE family efflux protein
MRSRHEMDLCTGPLLPQIIKYAIPLMITNVLQLLFNATDVAVLGMFVNDNAVGAVGATGSIITLITSVFIGVSIGANVIVARFAGEKNVQRARRAVGTSVVISLIIGAVLAVVGFFGARTFLELMNCEEKLIGMATKYLKIYFVGMPVIMLYNFAASILRAVGDTFRPMLYLIIGGFANVGLNLFFIFVCNMDVEGVAIGTVAAQLISVILSMIALLKSDGYSKLDLSYLKVYKTELMYMIKIGVPSGVQSSLFAISNVLIMSNVNLLGATTGNTVASQFDGLIYNAMYAISQSAIAFTSQNYGARNIARIRKAMWECIGVVTVISFAISGIVMIFARQLCGIMTDSEAVIDTACIRLYIMGFTYFLCGIMDVMSGVLRGLGKSTVATVICLLGSCVFRIVWLETVYKLNPTYEMIFYVYPISWILTILIYLPVISALFKKIQKKFESNTGVSLSDAV